MKKIVLLLAAFAFLGGAAFGDRVLATPLMSKNAIVQGDSNVQLTAAKKKKMFKKSKHQMRRSKHKGCGTFMYRSKKTGKCVDARA